ncbi:hypothetical protein QE152_g10713 [Popillia japonica]|uniref:Uncharacterized protein n=1 Tax=Popillia japonica TaxID=7064 RepID=A0AAW1LQ71_POPJA
MIGEDYRADVEDNIVTNSSVNARYAWGRSPVVTAVQSLFIHRRLQMFLQHTFYKDFAQLCRQLIYLHYLWLLNNYILHQTKKLEVNCGCRCKRRVDRHRKTTVRYIYHIFISRFVLTKSRYINLLDVTYKGKDIKTTNRN